MIGHLPGFHWPLKGYQELHVRTAVYNLFRMVMKQSIMSLITSNSDLIDQRNQTWRGKNLLRKPRALNLPPTKCTFQKDLQNTELWAEVALGYTQISVIFSSIPFLLVSSYSGLGKPSLLSHVTKLLIGVPSSTQWEWVCDLTLTNKWSLFLSHSDSLRDGQRTLTWLKVLLWTFL